uniref:Uncharacterized protein n=1 Tax=Rhizophora mucronata TaxID=61149 RepID=A0A2P2P2L0_RHIMU
MGFSKVSLSILLALLYAVLYAHAADPSPSPAPSPTSAAGEILPSFGIACFSAAVALLYGRWLNM